MLGQARTSTGPIKGLILELGPLSLLLLLVPPHVPDGVLQLRHLDFGLVDRLPLI